GVSRQCGHSLTGAPGEGTMNGKRGRALVVTVVLGGLVLAGPGRPAHAQAKPEGERRWALYVTLSAQWLPPAAGVGGLTPFLGMYAPPDARGETRPGNHLRP